MPRFTRHACVRYFSRRPGGLLRGKLNRFQIERLMRESFERSWFISVDEARARIGPVAKREWNQYFRADATGPGVWVTCWSRGEEVVLTYIYPGIRKVNISLKPLRSLRRAVAARRRLSRV